MNISDAWTALGWSWDDITKSLSEIRGTENRIAKAESLCAEAKKVARKLLAAHHPDTNPGDAGAARRFQHVKAAIDTIEKNTEAFKLAFEASKEKAQKRDVLIFIK